MVRATFRPRPPPPYAALMATGSPCSLANAMISSASATGSDVPATSGAPARLGDVAGLDLVAEGVDGRGWRTDPGQARVDHRLREAGVLGEESVAGVYGVGAGPLGDVEELVDG